MGIELADFCYCIRETFLFLSPFWQRKIESHNISLKNLTLTVLGKTLSFLAKS